MKVIYLFLLIPFLSFIDLPLKEAKLLISQKKYQAAIQVLSSDNSVEANYYRGFCYFHLGNCIASTQALNSFIQSENKYQSESWKNEARTLILKCQNRSNNTTQSIAINETKKTSKIEQLITDYQKSFIEINNALNQQNRYEDSIKFVEINGLNIESKNLKSFIIKSNDNSIAESKGIEKVHTNTKVTLKVDDESVNNPMTEEPEIRTIVNNPMTEEPEIKTIVNNPTTEEPDRKTIVNNEITVSEKKHHYKILFTIENQPDKIFMSLANIGPLTYEKANGENYIYYIGFFQSEEKAIDAREKVKASGYKMARIMEFNKGSLEKEFKEEKEQPTITEVLDKTTNTESKPVELQETPAPKAEESKQLEKPKEQIQEVIKSDVVSYHILFRVLDNPYEKFDNLKQFGPLYRETFDAKGSSRYLIGNTDDINLAKQLLDKVKKAGYPASFISEYINGSLSKIIQE